MINRATFNHVKLLLSMAMELAIAASFSLGQASTVAPQAQGAVSQLPAFEVSTVKPNRSGDGRMRFFYTADGLSITGMTINGILQTVFFMAFSGSEYRILDEPGWVKADRYDIEAKVGERDVPRWQKLTRDQRRAELQSLLADRFNLQFHHESRELPIYALVIAKNGPKLQEAKPGDTYPTGLKGPNGQGGPQIIQMKRGKITGQGVPVTDLLGSLTNLGLGRTIVDKTGLTGDYDFTLEWTPDDTPASMSGGPGGGPPGSGIATRA